MLKKTKRPGFQRFLGLPLAYDVSVGAVVFRRNPDGEREYLLLHYPNGHWDYVKGHIEENETHAETLKREAKEEADLDALEVIPGFHDKTHYFYIAKGNEREKRQADGSGWWIYKTVHFYLAETLQQPVTLSHEHVDAAWLPYERALECVTYENARRLLRKAEAFLIKQENIA